MLPRAALRVGTIALITASLAAVSASNAFAAWPHDPNVNVPLCTAAGDQTNPRTVSDGAGGAIVVWTDTRSGAPSDIYAQRVSAAGTPLWTANGLAICTAADYQLNPAIISDGAGGAIIAWQDQRSGFPQIYAQRVSAAGAVQWLANGVQLAGTSAQQANVALTSDGAGGAIVAWQDGRNLANWDLYAQRVNSAGAIQWGAAGVPVCVAANHQMLAVMSSDGAGGAIVAWQDFRSGTTWDIYAQRVNSAGVSQWTTDGVIASGLAGDQISPIMASDGAGGAIVAWQDSRNANQDVFAQRIAPGGQMEWTSSGVAVCTAINDQQRLAIAADGTGGAVIAWDDYRSGSNYDLYAQRVAPSGTMSWATNGVTVSNAPLDQQSPTVVSDGAGGAVIAWNDDRGGISYDIYAQALNANGVPQWTSGGTPICFAVGTQNLPVAASDGAGGAIIAWYDGRSAANYDIYCQRVEHFGYLGNPEPSIVNVRDVSGDNGGHVKVSWYPSWLDGVSDPNLAAYDVYRSAPTSVAMAAVKAGAHAMAGFGEAPWATGRSFVISPDAAQVYAWEFVGSVLPAHFLPTYGFIAPTTTDSMAAGNPKTPFMVVARNSSSSMYWLSAPDSGYSVDNLPPVIPAPFTAAYAAGATHLHWGSNTDADLAGYRLYRGSSSGFVPGAGNLISAQPDTGYNDIGPAGSWYKLSAIDVHGNESVYATLGPNGTLAAPGALVTALAFSPPAPNPSRGDGATFRIALPEAAHITLSIYDQQGRRVRDLVSGTWPAGEHRPRWDGRDETGRPAASGIYFARLVAMGRTLKVRFAVVR